MNPGGSQGDRTPRWIVLVGPTGTGKSEVAAALAERIGGEIVGCDALQVYRGLDAATAKPTPTLRARAPHHLLDVAAPTTDYSLADYVREADRAIEGIVGRGHVPNVAGGTGLYLRGLLRGVIPAPPRDTALRERLRRIVERGGSRHLRRYLERADPASAQRVPASDVQRTLRAIELARSGGGTWSERLERYGRWSTQAEREVALKVGLDAPREWLNARLDRRVEEFFRHGLVEEVRGLLAAGVPPEANAFKGLGYREVLAALRHGVDPQAVVEDVQRNTRRYAKRQRTWFRHEPGVWWLDADESCEVLAEQIAARFEQR
jgi:tRNA dimethylallyltransferase